MSKVIAENISQVRVNVIPLERTPTSQGSLALDPRVARMYLEKGYDSSPKTQDEADARGVKNFNGLVSSIPSLHIYSNGKETVVAADIAPTRYLIGQAARDVITQSKLGEDDSRQVSPRMANVSLLVPVKWDGDYFLLGQIKGKALGSGEILAALVAGNVDAEHLHTCHLHPRKDPLTEALKQECPEEVGINLSYLDSTSFVALFDDGCGGVNFASVARNADLSSILGSFETFTQSKLSKGEVLETLALSLMPAGGLVLWPISDKKKVKDATCFFPSADGLVTRKEDRVVRPYTEAVAEYIEKEENLRFLMEKAGI